MLLAKGLRRRLARLVHATRPYRGNVDGVFDGALTGWVLARDPASGPVRVGLYTRRGLLAQGVANIYRGDLKEAGIGTGHHAFALPLSPAVLRTIAEDGGRVTVRVLDRTEFALGSEILLVPGGADALTDAPGGAGDPLKRLLFGDLQRWRDLLAAVAEAGPGGLPDDAVWPDLPPDAPHRRMFTREDYLHGGTLPPGMTAYGDYVRYRYKLDRQFDLAQSADAAAHFQNWYVAGYSTMRRGLRVPMSRDLIAWWNEPVVIPGQRMAVTRATWSFILGVPPLVHSMDFGNSDWTNWVTFWWSVRQARAMNVEDCLVPEAYAERLRRVPEAWDGKPDAPSEFMLRLHAETPELAGFALEDRVARLRLGATIALMAAQRPDYLRFLPEGLLDRLFDGQEPLLPALWREFAGEDAPVLDRPAFEAALRLQGFDPVGLRFLNFTAEGDRLEAAILPGPPRDAEPVDIQIIGPFEKASGLGQATRLSAAVLSRTGRSVNCVNFGLDNPAPEGFSRVGDLSGYRRAKVNLIHLNAESIPLAFAYQPDVFSGAYNIGYFFWELDSPAACHYLGMNMLDEIWVSTEYGVSIFRPHAPGPVTNVGMCFEDLPEIGRDEARAYLQRKTGFSGREFVFFVAFDSFSFVQRKNPVGTLKAFARAFEGVRDVRLVIKTQNRRKVADPAQLRIWEKVDALVAADKRISIIDETLSYDDLLRLKKGTDCYISLHKSEGWGFGMIEAMNLKLPVVCTAYSGNMDFCSDETAFLVGYREVELDDDDYIFVLPGQKWAEPDIADAARQMRLVHDDAALRQAKAEAGHAYVRTHFSAEAIARRYAARMDEIMKGLDGQGRKETNGKATFT